MRAIQITEMTGPRTSLKLVEVPVPERSHPMTPGEGGADPGSCGRGVVPRGPAVEGHVPDQAGAAVHSGQRGGGNRRQRARGFGVRRRRPSRRFRPARRLRGVRGRPGLLHLPFGGRARLPAGGRADPQLPHRVFRARQARPIRERGDGAGARSRRRSRDRRRCRSPGVSAPRRSPLCPPTRRSASRGEAGADHVLRSDGPWKDQCKELGGADIVIDPVGGARFTDSLRSLRPYGRVVVVGFTEGSIPEVARQPAAADQHRGRRRGVGRGGLQRAGVSRRDRDGARRSDRRRVRASDHRRELPVGARRRCAGADRRSRRGRQGRARRRLSDRDGFEPSASGILPRDAWADRPLSRVPAVRRR